MVNPELRIWINTSVHGVSLAMMMIEMILCRIKMQARMVILILVNVVLYMLLVFVNYASRHNWVYPLLSWDHGPVTVGIYFGMGAAFVAVFFVQVFFHYVRDCIAKRKCCCI
ncbi:hypothetical protein BJV82DRAFT_556580 [Fennellomyces sp. T-0311]|nr:hypothetical protein BJV82DRAFT_556580 [Fennellomyces sp. T-0311]